MPSNMSKFGVDYDGNGHIDLRNSAVDAIGSIANYLAQHGWQRDRPIAFLARYTGTILKHYCQRFNSACSLWIT
jgi:membrane-bound lytic murein transglycosylase B